MIIIIIIIIITSAVATISRAVTASARFSISLGAQWPGLLRRGPSTTRCIVIVQFLSVLVVMFVL